MPKYNIYKIKDDCEEALFQKLDQVGLTQTYDQQHGNYSLRFLFSNEPDLVDVWWLEEYQDFISSEGEAPKNRLYFAVLFISSENSLYAVSLGKTHFYLSSFCDTDFGLNLAERILDRNELKVKHSKYYKSNKKKSITSFGSGNEMTYDAGESMHFIKGETVDEGIWGKSVSFGHSIHLKIDKRPAELIEVVDAIESALSQEPVIRIPKVEVVTDETNRSLLDMKLFNAIFATNDPQLNIQEFTVSGVNFIFTDNYNYKIYRKNFSRSKVALNNFNVDEILGFISRNQIVHHNELNDLKISVERDEGRGFSRPLKYYLDFIDDEERHCLIDGEWYHFNQSYVEYLHEEVDKIQFTYDQHFNIQSGIIESEFNNDRELYDGYINYDADLTSIDGKYKVEKMDLYKDNSLFFVKKGKPQKLGYTIDQAITTIKILQQNQSDIEIQGESVSIQNIVLWFILDRRTEISSLSDINSIVLHIKIAEWRRLCRESDYNPLVYINYVR